MNAIEIKSLGKMYKLYSSNADRARDLFHLNFRKAPLYKEFWALRNVDLTVEKGSRIGIIGRNGAGKSTMLKIICGNIAPTEGSVKVNGNIQALLQMGAGFVPDFTGMENIKNSLAYNGIFGRQADALVDEIVDFSELGHYIDLPIKFYSAGMYSRLAFSVSTALEPDILIIDEVLGAGDAAFASKCADRMKRLTQESGATVLFVSHSMESVLDICDKAILMEHGQIVERGTALAVSKIYNKKIREEEERRIRMREQAGSQTVQTERDYYQDVLFRLRTDEPHPKKVHRIYHVALRDGQGDCLAELDFGGPMDNDPEAPQKILDEQGKFDWSASAQDKRGFYRAYQDCGGEFAQAVFQLTVPRSCSLTELEICFTADAAEGENVYLEYFDGAGYHRITALESGYHTLECPLVAPTPEPELSEAEPAGAAEERTADPAEEELPEETEIEAEIPAAEALTLEAMREDNSIYGTEEMTVDSMDLFDASGKSRRVFFAGESMRFEINVTAHQPIREFCAVLCIMTTTGHVVSQFFCPSDRLGLSPVEGSHTISVELGPMRFGPEEYMVSVGLFKTCNFASENEEPSYCVADRALMFHVKKPEQFNKSLGAFITPCVWESGAHRAVFDGVEQIKAVRQEGERSHDN